MNHRKRMILLALTALTVTALGGWLMLTPVEAAFFAPPPNDLLALGQGPGQQPATVPVQHNQEPPLTPSPRAVCGKGSHPLSGIQGRVPASALNTPAGRNGYTCNLSVISQQGQSGGFKVLRYIDTQGHECAFYDTALLYPTNAITLTGPPSQGVAVLDMSYPSHPVQTATLTTPPMLSPHESLSLNARRGLLAAVLGNPSTHPGLVSIYDVSRDCRHPIEDSTAPVARFGHEGNFSPDGRIFYAAGTSVKSVTAIDVTDPKRPHPYWNGVEYSHGLTIGAGGNRAYIADPINSQLLILDTSQIQAHKSNPQAFEISRLTWGPATIPQNAIPITIHGTPYVFEFDEYAFRYSSPAPPDTVGAARLINVSDERHPYVVSNMRLEVDQPAQHHDASHDPGTLDPAQGYAAHYCNVPSRVNPQIAACSFISSGLRVFDIRDPYHPKEAAYFVSPPKQAFENGGDKSNFAMSRPTFVPERREIWYSDGTSGFYALRVPKRVWPNPVPARGQTCLRATGRIAGRHLGPVALGDRRHVLRRRLPRYGTRRRKSMDFYCLTGGGVRAGFPSRKLLRSLSRPQRRRVAGRAVLALTADRLYALRGVRPGTKLAKARRRLHPGRGFKIGLNWWYIVPGSGANGVLKVRHGRIEEIGIADKRLTRDRASAFRFMSAFD